MSHTQPETITKAERYDRVADALVRTLLREGPGALRIATVARRAGVSRAWIYKHFGSDTAALIDYTARLLGDAFTELGRSNASEDIETWAANIQAATRRGLRDGERAPWTMRIWMRWRHDPGPLGKALREVQQRHLDKFVADMPPGLRRRADARTFAVAFQAARIGVYHSRLDQMVRDQVHPEAVCRPLDDMLHGFLARTTQT